MPNCRLSPEMTAFVALRLESGQPFHSAGKIPRSDSGGKRLIVPHNDEFRPNLTDRLPIVRLMPKNHLRTGECLPDRLTTFFFRLMRRMAL